MRLFTCMHAACMCGPAFVFAGNCAPACVQVYACFHACFHACVQVCLLSGVHMRSEFHHFTHNFVQIGLVLYAQSHATRVQITCKSHATRVQVTCKSLLEIKPINAFSVAGTHKRATLSVPRSVPVRRYEDPQTALKKSLIHTANRALFPINGFWVRNSFAKVILFYVHNAL